MLMDAIERYVALRRTAGFGFDKGARHLRSYAQFAQERGDTHVRTSTGLDWAGAGSTPLVRQVRLQHLILFARFQNAEDERHEIPPRDAFVVRVHRPLPYIFSNLELARLLEAAGRLRQPRAYPLRRETFRMFFGLIATTGLRRTEAIDLRLKDVSADGVLTIRRTKFRKSRLIPLHASVFEALQRYLVLRLHRAVEDDHLFLSVKDGPIHPSVANVTFSRMLKLAGIAPDRMKRPRIHDLRHTFATRALERCPTDRSVIARQLVAVSTYLGHVNMETTQWYLEATPELMVDIATAAETLVWGGAS